jgi:hypothetical protein
MHKAWKNEGHGPELILARVVGISDFLNKDKHRIQHGEIASQSSDEPQNDRASSHLENPRIRPVKVIPPFDSVLRPP